jgi:LPS-assembly lipoprotein
MKNFILMVALLSLAACGMRPVYGVNRDMPVGVEEKLEQVSIGNIPDREGQYLRNALIDRFYRSGRPSSPAYTLNFTPVTESRTELDITKASDTTRAQLRLYTTMSLNNSGTGQTLFSRDLTAITSYNVLGNEFATRVTEDNARTNALDELARQAEMHTGLYFRRQ